MTCGRCDMWPYLYARATHVQLYSFPALSPSVAVEVAHCTEGLGGVCQEGRQDFKYGT